MLRVFPISLTGAVSRWLRNEPTGSIKTWEDLKTKFLNKYCPPGRTAKKIEEINNFQQEVILFYNGLDIPTRQILDLRGSFPTKTAANAKKAIQEMAEYSQKWHNRTSKGRSTETSDGLAAIQAQLNNLGREIKKVNENFYAAQVGCEQCKGPHYTKASTDAAIRNQGASIKTLEIQIGQMSKVLQEREFGSLPSSTKTNLRDQVKSISTTIKADSNSIRHIGSTQYVVSTGQNRTIFYKPRQMTFPFPGHLEDRYCEEEGNYRPKFMEAYGASLINNTIP
ncbi:reverse transcriptase domain-containing protein [Tanacetum coccineum]